MHKNQYIASFFNMASLNINNHMKFSLDFIHRNTVVFLRCLAHSRTRDRFKVSTLVCATEQAFVSNKDYTQKSEVQQRPPSHTSKKNQCGAPVIS